MLTTWWQCLLIRILHRNSRHSHPGRTSLLQQRQFGRGGWIRDEVISPEANSVRILSPSPSLRSMDPSTNCAVVQQSSTILTGPISLRARFASTDSGSLKVICMPPPLLLSSQSASAPAQPLIHLKLAPPLTHASNPNTPTTPQSSHEPPTPRRYHTPLNGEWLSHITAPADMQVVKLLKAPRWDSGRSAAYSMSVCCRA